MKARTCPDCGRLAEWDGGSTRCSVCQAAHNRDQRHRYPYHHSREYRSAAAAVRGAAKANRRVVCWLCGSRTPPPGLNGEWSADHVRPGDPDSPLRAAHVGCNSRRGDGG